MEWHSDKDGLLGTSTPSTWEMLVSLILIYLDTHTISMNVTDDIGSYARADYINGWQSSLRYDHRAIRWLDSSVGEPVVFQAEP